MADTKNIMTKSGIEEMERELEYLKVTARKEIAQKIKEAREQGDLSENAEYDAAKDEQRDIEARIEELTNILKNAEVIDEDESDGETVTVGCSVVLIDIETNEELKYKIVGSTEANSLKGKLSNESPLGKALLGAAIGETIKAEAPAGIMEYKLISISR